MHHLLMKQRETGRIYHQRPQEIRCLSAFKQHGRFCLELAGDIYCVESAVPGENKIYEMNPRGKASVMTFLLLPRRLVMEPVRFNYVRSSYLLSGNVS